MRLLLVDVQSKSDLRSPIVQSIIGYRLRGMSCLVCKWIFVTFTACMPRFHRQLLPGRQAPLPTHCLRHTASNVPPPMPRLRSAVSDAPPPTRQTESSPTSRTRRTAPDSRRLRKRLLQYFSSHSPSRLVSPSHRHQSTFFDA